jgi:hypothetical protein
MIVSSTIQLTANTLFQEQQFEISSEDTTTRSQFSTSDLKVDDASVAASTIPKSAFTIDNSSFDFSTSTISVRLKKI